jgi:hypothetical protein
MMERPISIKDIIDVLGNQFSTELWIVLVHRSPHGYEK